jgi:phosphatidylglycerol lysyltransferase
VVFDLAVAAGLFRFLYKRSTASLTPLAVAVTLDALLTPVQAVLWNLPRARSALDFVIIAVACLAPALASVVLWGARRLRFSDPG